MYGSDSFAVESYVDAAFVFGVAGPAALTVALPLGHAACAGHAADRRIAGIEQGMLGELMAIDIGHEIIERPIEQWIEADAAVGHFHLFHARAGGGLEALAPSHRGGKSADRACQRH